MGSGREGVRQDLDDGLTVWLTGLPCSGKSTVATAIADRLRAEGRLVELLDGDEVRQHLSTGLGFSKDDRETNIRRVGYVAHLLARNGVVAICALISPYRAARDEVRLLHGGRFIEVYLSAPVDVCSQRDVKGLFARQRAGELKGLTGVDDPYEPPLRAEIVLPTHQETAERSTQVLWDYLHR